MGAQAVSVVLSLVLVWKKGLPFAVEKVHLRFDEENSGSVLKLDAPIALQSMCNEVDYIGHIISKAASRQLPSKISRPSMVRI